MWKIRVKNKNKSHFHSLRHPANGSGFKYWTWKQQQSIENTKNYALSGPTDIRWGDIIGNNESPGWAHCSPPLPTSDTFVHWYIWYFENYWAPLKGCWIYQKLRQRCDQRSDISNTAPQTIHWKILWISGFYMKTTLHWSGVLKVLPSNWNPKQDLKSIFLI